ncbi:MAG: hypothetical protein Q8M22_06030, partial [Actinomycetota bacterium]|nr:hypothetical protein [Actinomycetota bacterium]
MTTFARGAVVSIASFEWRQRRPSIVAVGLVAGVVGGVLAGGAALTSRTASAPERLAAAVDVGDASVSVFGGRELADEIAALESIERYASTTIFVGQLAGDQVQYVGMVSAPPGALVQPVVMAGRRADPAVANEVMITERIADVGGFGPGDVLTVSLLTAEEVTQFDTGFGEPDGATVELEVVGVARTPTGVFDTGPLLITPALVELHPESVAGVALYVELRAGRAGVAAFTEEVDAIAAAADPTPGGDEFLPAVVEDPLAGTRALDHSSRVLVGGMTIALAVAVLAALLALAQATGRHHARSAGNQRIERA